MLKTSGAWCQGFRCGRPINVSLTLRRDRARGSRPRGRRGLFAAGAMIAAAALPLASKAFEPPPSSLSDIPATFAPAPKDQDFVRREAMIPMRDGVKLHAVMMIPKGAVRAPIILDRTPYNADHLTSLSETGPAAGRLVPLHADLFRAGYIVVVEDVRGKYGSEGDYVMTRPLSGPLNATKVDHATDAFDTIDWLVRNVPESNGKVGTTGISYDGFTCLMTLINPHPALKASAPIDPMVDGWMGDDWFHNGAFRQPNLEYVYKQTTTKASTLTMDEGAYDVYEPWLNTVSVDGMARAVGMQELPYYKRFLAHPAYDAYWAGQAVDKLLSSKTLSVPTLIIHGQWDQEDIYGGPAVWKAVKPKDAGEGELFFAMGPWNHGGAGLADGSALGPIKFGSDTASWFRANVLIPFFDARLKDAAAAPNTAVVTAFETGVNMWRTYDVWPQSCAAGCPYASKALYLNAKGGLDIVPSPPGSDPGFDEFISDPARPVTYRARPIRPTAGAGSTWSQWLVDDQRFAEARPDVATYVSPPLKTKVRIAGQPIAHLIASTSGADSDFVVKLIDVYPPEVPRDAALGGYELPVSMDILRGRYRDNPAKPTPLTPNAPTAFTLALPNADHVFLPGHRIMVQIQSSWFPLYDRNPQSWVDNIFTAPASAYVKAVQRIYRRTTAQSYIELPVAP